MPDPQIGYPGSEESCRAGVDLTGTDGRPGLVVGCGLWQALPGGSGS